MAKKAARRSTRRAKAKKTTRRAATPRKAFRKRVAPPKARKIAPVAPAALFAPVKGAEQRNVGRVMLDVGRAGDARIKRMIYPVGFRWSVDMKPAVGTGLCMHAHAGFLAHGEIHIEYADGCVIEHKAPQIVSIEPGHDGWVVGNQPVVIIEVDFEGDTVARLGMPESHQHR